MKSFGWLGYVVVALAAGCGTNGPDYIPGFDPPPVEAGYTRFVTPVVEDLKPGANIEYCAWVAAPAEKTQDVLAFSGKQSATGHHVVLYATSEKYPVGESHVCTTEDMLSVSFVGGVGGEGLATA